MGKNQKAGKRGKGRETRKSNVRVDSECKEIPQLPVEIFGVVAEHLIVDYAFGTTASLNMTCQAVRQETLPILWETVFCQPGGRVGSQGNNDDALPVELKYTKFLFTGFESPRDQPFWKALPKIVMVVSYGPRGNPRELRNPENHVRIYKPVSSTTGFTVLNTPIRHHEHNHDHCDFPENIMDDNAGFVRDFLDVFPAAALPTCRAQTMQPVVRPMATIRKVHLELGAAIHARAPTCLKRPTTSLLLRDTVLAAEEGADDLDLRSTALELLKLAGLQTLPSHFPDVENQLLEEFRSAAAGTPMCRYRPMYADWHLRLAMNVAMALSFVAKLEAEAETCPDMLKNRLHIAITGIIDASELHSVIGTLQRTLRRKVLTTHAFLPLKAIPQQIVACQAVARTRFPDNLVAMGAPRFLNTPIIGTITFRARDGRIGLVGEINADRPEDVVRAYEREHLP